MIKSTVLFCSKGIIAPIPICLAENNFTQKCRYFTILQLVCTYQVHFERFRALLAQEVPEPLFGEGGGEEVDEDGQGEGEADQVEQETLAVGAEVVRTSLDRRKAKLL